MVGRYIRQAVTVGLHGFEQVMNTVLRWLRYIVVAGLAKKLQYLWEIFGRPGLVPAGLAWPCLVSVRSVVFLLFVCVCVCVCVGMVVLDDNLVSFCNLKFPRVKFFYYFEKDYSGQTCPHTIVD